MPRIDVLISVIRILSIFFYTAILQGLTIQQYKNRRGEYINKNKKNKSTNKQTNKKNKNRKIK